MHTDSAKLGRMLVAVDFSASSRAALQQAVQLAGYSTSPIEVLHVVQGEVGSAQAIMKEFLSSIPVPLEVTLATRFEIGEPSATIVKIAGMEAHDLILIGAHGWSMLWSVRLGEVAEKVVRLSPCPVLAVQPPAEQSGESVLPWLPRDASTTQRVDLKLGSSQEPLGTMFFHCPQTGAGTTAVECLHCPKLIAGCLSASASALELICRNAAR